jgi:murein DD-endopeptidase MepM/ murein hydrolase activator NlpD
MTETIITKESFIINDIVLDVNPSDIRLIEDNYAMQDSYIRTNAVFAYRSKYASTKISITIPVELDDMMLNNFDLSSYEYSGNYSNIPNTLKLLVQLCNYPFCFIKSNRVQTYVTPTSISSTNFMIFAIDEMNLMFRSEVSNVAFLELVICYYNHTPFVKDFSFSKTVSMVEYSSYDAFKFKSEGIQNSGVPYLGESESWKRYFLKIMTDIRDLSTIESFKLGSEVVQELFNTLRVQIAVPNVTSVTADSIEELGHQYGNEAKFVITTNVDPLNADILQQLYADKKDGQDFSQLLKQTDQDSNGKSAWETYTKVKGVITYDDVLKAIDEKASDPMGEFYSRNKLFVIEWADMDLELLRISVQSISIRKKNKLASNHIGSYKYPVIQYMGRYPTEVAIQFTTNVGNSYLEQSGEIGLSSFIKNQFNILDRNRTMYPEMLAHNYLKIKSLGTIFSQNIQYIPNQYHLSANSTEQGLETFNCTFIESNLESLLELGEMTNSGKKSTGEQEGFTHDVVIKFLTDLSTYLSDRKNASKLSNEEKSYILEIYYKCLLLVNMYRVEAGSKSVLETTLSTLPLSELEQFLAYALAKISSQLFQDLVAGTAAVATAAVVAFFSVFSAGTTLGLAIPASAGGYWLANEAMEVAGINANPYFYSTVFEGLVPSEVLEYHVNWISNGAKGGLIENIKARKLIVTGNGKVIQENINNYVSFIFRERGETKILLNEIVGMIAVGSGKNNQLCKSVTDAYAEKFAAGFDTSIVTFTGQAIPDLNLQTIHPDYKEASDLAVQSLNPFFFLVENKWFNDSEIKDTFSVITDTTQAIEQSLGAAITEIVSEDKSNINPAIETRGRLKYTEPVEAKYVIDTEQEALSSVGNAVGVTNDVPTSSSTLPATTGANDITSLADVPVDSNKDELLAHYSTARSTGLRLSEQDWLLFANTVAFYESRNRTNIVGGMNNHFLGKYQMGDMALFDIGFLNKKSPNSTTLSGAWTETGLNREVFLNSPSKQAEAFAKYVAKNYTYVANNFKKEGLPQFSSLPLKVQLACLAAAHFGHTYAVPVYRDRSNPSGTKSLLYYDKILLVFQDRNASSTTNKSTTQPIQKAVFVAVLSCNEFRAKLSDGTVKDYLIEGTIDPRQATNVKKLSAGQSFDKLQNLFQSTMNLYKNLQIQETGFTAPPNKKTIVKVFTDKGLSLNLTVLNQGYAVLDPAYEGVSGYLNASDSAKDNKKGLYSADLVSTLPSKSLVSADETTSRVFSEAELNKYRKVTQLYNSKTDIGYILSPPQVPFKDKSVKYKISSGFGARSGSPNGHRGVDVVGQGFSILGSHVQPTASGTVVFAGVRGAYGNAVFIDHGNGYTSAYGHLNSINVKTNSVVKGLETVIGTAGSTGRSTGPHLHYEISYKGTRINPKDVTDLQKLVGNSGGYSTEKLQSYETNVGLGGQITNPKRFVDTVAINNNSTSIYDEGLWVSRFSDMLAKNINRGLSQSFPTIKVYATVGNEDQDFFVGLQGSQIQYYEIKGVRDFHLTTNNSENPVDVVSMIIADPNFLKTDEMTALANNPVIDYKSIGTDYETKFKNNRLQLKPGMKLHIRMGYFNNPNKLDIVFNGSVTSCYNVHTNAIQVIAEGFGKELLSEIIGSNEPKRLGGGWNSSTGSIFADLMVYPSLYHFGKSYSFGRMLFEGSLGDQLDPESKSLLASSTSILQTSYKRDDMSDGVFNSNYYLGFKLFNNIIQRSRVNTNIYAADIEHVDSQFDSPIVNLFSNILSPNKPVTYDYYAVNETPWDVMKQMEHRHPGTIVKPMWYQDRCTLFYGIKEQLYIARDTNMTLMSLTAKDLIDNEDWGVDKQSNIKDAYSTYRDERMDPAFNFHLVSSEFNMISNGIKLNADYFTKVSVGYRDDDDDISNKSAWETLPMMLDDNLAAWEIRGSELTMSGCDHRYMAYRYGTNFLIKEAEKMYDGKITLLGNPSMKAGDYAFINDTSRKMYGVVKIRECFHHYDERNGFITEIIPGQFVEPAEFLRSSLFLRAGLTSKALTSELTGKVLEQAYSEKNFEEFRKLIFIQTRWSKLARGGDGILNRNTPGVINAYRDLIEDGDYGFLAPPLVLSGFMLAFARNTYKRLGFNGQFTKSFVSLGTIVKEVGKASISGIVRGTTFTYGVGKGVVKGLLNARQVLTGWRAALSSASVGSVVGRLASLGGSTIGLAIRAGTIAVQGALLAISAIPAIFSIVAFGLVVSWVNAQVEEERYTRQPAMFYPLIQHGRPYVAGMAGVIRNEWLSSKLEEYNKNENSIRKAATIVKNKRSLSGESASILADLFAKRDANERTPTFIINEDGQITTDKYGR